MLCFKETRAKRKTMIYRALKTKTQGWTQLHRNGAQFLLHIFQHWYISIKLIKPKYLIIFTRLCVQINHTTFRLRIMQYLEISRYCMIRNRKVVWKRNVPIVYQLPKDREIHRTKIIQYKQRKQHEHVIFIIK
jgi:hypothetical protein